MDFGAMIAAAEFSWLSPGSWGAMAQVVLGIGLVIFIHELGHFLVAKACGVKCEKFYVGFDFFDLKIGDRVIVPRSLVKFQWGETEYGVGIVPLGGYVKMLGQEDNPGAIEAENRRAEGGGDDEGSQAAAADPVPLDPRSFQAKSVLQRMAIISAGVVFNLVSAVFLAGIAFMSGARYQPATIGSATVGGPAWEANLSGGRVLSINGNATDLGYFPFADLVQETFLNGTDKPLEVVFQPYGSTEKRDIRVTPEMNLIPGVDLPMVGMGPEMAAQLGNKDEAIQPGSAASRAEPPFEKNDRIVRLDDLELPTLELDGKTLVPVTAMRRVLTEKAHLPVRFTVRRGDQEIGIVVPPNPAPAIGLIQQWSPVQAVQQDSPAAQAGIAAGDLILSVNGEPVGDPLDFDQRICRMMSAATAKGESLSLTLEIRRGAKGKGGATAESGAAATGAADQPVGDSAQAEASGTVEKVVLTPRLPMEPTLAGTEPMALSTLGIAVHPTVIVEGVRPGSPAAETGIQSGDRIRKVRLLLPATVPESGPVADWRRIILETQKERQNLFGAGKGEEQKPRDRIGVALNMIRSLPVGSRFEVTFERQGQVQPPVVLASVESADSFLPTRGLLLTPLESVYYAKTYSEALKLGARQTWNDAGRIGKTLKKLVSGQISPTNLGGPGTIAIAATMEASEGTSRLLLFLTMLSANLAIINFLPIPVLDGGHMVFLAYEGIFRRPVTEKVQILLSYVGLFLILGLMVFVFSLDIFRIFTLLR